jgi:hypothetical protein
MMGEPEIDDISLTPNEKEYKKLKRVMKIMVKFYDDGSEAKLEQCEAMEREIKKIETDEQMIEAQIACLKPFPDHPKRTSTLKLLDTELTNLRKQKETFLNKAKEFKELHQWSLGVSECVRWLESNMDEYCSVTLGMDLKYTPAASLTKEQYIKYKTGLDEITTNLQESQDFFQATLDGRIKKYQEQEKAMIEAQLKVLEEFPPMNARRNHWETELNADMEHLQVNMEESPAVLRRRQAMLDSHKDFFKVLKWNREKLKLLTTDIPEEPAQQEKQEQAAAAPAGKCPFNHGNGTTNGTANANGNGEFSVFTLGSNKSGMVGCPVNSNAKSC